MTNLFKQIILGEPERAGNMGKKKPLPTNELLLDRLVSCGLELPDAASLAPHAVIRAIRGGLRMTQAEVARRAGLPQSHLAKIESGKVDVRLGTLRKILGAMFCEPVLLARFQKTPQAALAERVGQAARRRVASAAGSLVRERRAGYKTRRGLVRAEERRLLDGPGSAIWREIPPPPDPAARARAAKRAGLPIRIVDKEDPGDDLAFWLGKSPAERIGAMEVLREQFYALSGRKTLPRISHTIRFRERGA